MKDNYNAAKQSVIAAVKLAIEKHPLNGTSLDIWEKKVVKYDGWWRVPLLPNSWPKHLSPLYEVLAEIEGDLQDDQRLDILLSLGQPVNVDRPPRR